MKKLSRSKLALKITTIRKLDSRAMGMAHGGHGEYTEVSGRYLLALRASNQVVLKNEFTIQNPAALC